VIRPARPHGPGGRCCCHIERTLGSLASLFAQFVAGYTGRGPEYRGCGDGQQAAWPVLELQELLDEWMLQASLRMSTFARVCQLLTVWTRQQASE
jgi:putative transposase